MSKLLSRVRSPKKAQHLIEQGIERHLDLDRHETLTPALEGIDRTLLLTGYSVDLLKHCVYTQLKLNAANKIPCADATFDNFEKITGRKPMTWQDFAQKHQAFDY